MRILKKIVFLAGLIALRRKTAFPRVSLSWFAFIAFTFFLVSKNKEVFSVNALQQRTLLQRGISTPANWYLLSWLSGYQYTLDVESRNHQINATVTSPRTTPIGRRVHSPLHIKVLRSLPGTMSRGVWNPSAGVPGVAFNNVERNEPVSSISRILREPPSSRERFLPDASWSKGRPRNLPKRPFGKAETPKEWFRAQSYHVHPYWTTNLKYVC
jgi:hypothetical protein